MGEDLHSIDHVPTQPVAAVEVIDHPEGDEGVVTEPGVADDEPGENADDGGEYGPCEKTSARCGFFVHVVSW